MSRQCTAPLPTAALLATALLGTSLLASTPASASICSAAMTPFACYRAEAVSCPGGGGATRYSLVEWGCSYTQVEATAYCGARGSDMRWSSTEAPDDTECPPLPRPRTCPSRYSPGAFRGQVGRVAVYNEWSRPLKVVLYHPDNQARHSEHWVQPGRNEFLGELIVGDDWGLCLEAVPAARTGAVLTLGNVSNFETQAGQRFFMVQNRFFK